MQNHNLLQKYDKIITESKPILEQYDLCDYCLGRFFIKKTNFSSVKKLGREIRNSINAKDTVQCYICKDIFSLSDFYVKMMLDASDKYQFSTILVGTILKQSITERDDKIRSEFCLRGVDSIKTLVTRELEKKFTKITHGIIDHLSPDITLTINFKTEHCDVKTRHLFLYGRYTKSKRGLSQKQKSCEDCYGRGCLFCDNHGIVSFDSVEGKISKVLYKKFQTEHVKFTWMGSEDKESLVLGNGRPFFAKLISPKKSDVLLPKKSHQDEIVIHDLRKIDHIPKGTIPFKSKITLLIETKNKITSEKLKELKHLDGIPIIVTDERGIRHKKIIHSLKYKKESARSFFVILEADGGLPIKRFVEGINVDPSIGKILDTKCSCRQFDINQILP